MNFLSYIRDIARELDFSAGLSVGLVRGVNVAISLVAVATIVFGGDLSPYVLTGIGMILVGTAVLSLTLTFLGEFAAPVSTTPIPVALVLIAIADSIVLSGEALHLTFVALIVVAAVISGVLLFAIGYFRIANYLRFIPFVVSAGALAGAGVLILVMALALVGLSWQIESWDSLFEPIAAVKWISSLVLGVLLVVIPKLWRKSYALPLIFLAFCVLFHGLLIFLDVSIDEATEQGLFMSVDWSQSMWPPMSIGELGHIQWPEITGRALDLGVLFLVLLILTVVGVSQLELASSKDFDWDKEFKAHGVANLLSAICGGVPGATIPSASLPNIALRAMTPVTSVVISIVLLLFVVYGMEVLRFLPIPAASGYLIAISAPLISDWLIKTWKKLSLIEYTMLLLICATIVIVGFLEAIALGLLLSLVFLAVQLSQVHVVSAQYSVADRRSRKRRSAPDQAILTIYGRRCSVFRLQGYVFFGSAFSLAEQLKASVGDRANPVCVVLDFANVTGFDLSAIESLRSYMQRASENGVATVVSSASERLKQEVQRDLSSTLSPDLRWSEDEDKALEVAEDILIERYLADSERDRGLRDRVFDDASSLLARHLDRQTMFEQLVSSLSAVCRRIDYAAHEDIVSAGKISKGMQLLLSGTASARSSQNNELLQYQPGDVIESSSAFELSEAEVSVVGEGPCETLLVTPEIRSSLELENNPLALLLYQYTLSAQQHSHATAAPKAHRRD